MTILQAEKLSKSYRSEPIFTDLSVSFGDGERCAIIGANGVGKTTLLKILARQEQPDDGRVIAKKLMKVTYVPQESHYPPLATVATVLGVESDHDPKLLAISRYVTDNGLPGLSSVWGSLSGGQKKRVDIVKALLEESDMVLFDEPTNHLDLAGLQWIETILLKPSFAFVMISHDRFLIERVAKRVIEINPGYPQGYLDVAGGFYTYQERRSQLLSDMAKTEQTMANKARREVAWLRAGVKARTTKSQSRIDMAHKLLADLQGSYRKHQQLAIGPKSLTFAQTDKQGKELLSLKEVTYAYGENPPVISGFNLTLYRGTAVCLVGANGSGKTTIIKLLSGELSPQSGTRSADISTRVIHVSQMRDECRPDETLKRIISPHSDFIDHQQRRYHIVAWAEKFGFQADQLDTTFQALSGGQKARAILARTMWQPCDVLLMDEPTNDLDLVTLEVLEQSLLEFQGALLLVTHDRFLCERVADLVIALMPGGGAPELFASYSQFEDYVKELKQKPEKVTKGPEKVEAKRATSKKKLSYMEQREFDSLEAKIMEEEEKMARLKDIVEQGPKAAADKDWDKACQDLVALETLLGQMYERWAHLESHA